MNMTKTWKDLKHGDMIKTSSGNQHFVVDVLPHSIILNSHQIVSFKFLDENGWQIVQPEEEKNEEKRDIALDQEDLKNIAALIALISEEDLLDTSECHYSSDDYVKEEKVTRAWKALRLKSKLEQLLSKTASPRL